MTQNKRLFFIACVGLSLAAPMAISLYHKNNITITFPKFSHPQKQGVELAATTTKTIIPVPRIPETQQPVDDAISEAVEGINSLDNSDIRDAEPVLSVTPDDLTVINNINAIRKRSGLKPYKVNACLMRAATLRIDDMIAKSYFSHRSPEGYHSNYFINEAGYSYIFAGENLARGYPTINDAINAWVASPTHYKNILDPDFTETGVSIEGDLIVHLFAKPSSTNNCK